MSKEMYNAIFELINLLKELGISDNQINKMLKLSTDSIDDLCSIYTIPNFEVKEDDEVPKLKGLKLYNKEKGIYLDTENNFLFVKGKINKVECIGILTDNEICPLSQSEIELYNKKFSGYPIK
jgi:hypothetical protein